MNLERFFTLFFQDKVFLMHFFFQGRTSVDKEGVNTQVFAVGEWLLIRNLNSVFIF